MKKNGCLILTFRAILILCFTVYNLFESLCYLNENLIQF